MVYAGSVGYVVNEGVVGKARELAGEGWDTVKRGGRWVGRKAKGGAKGAWKYAKKGAGYVGLGAEKLASGVGHIPGAIGGGLSHIPGIRRLDKGFRRGARSAYDYVS